MAGPPLYFLPPLGAGAGVRGTCFAAAVAASLFFFVLSCCFCLFLDFGEASPMANRPFSGVTASEDSV